jgi:phage anti-repressor protein
VIYIRREHTLQKRKKINEKGELVRCSRKHFTEKIIIRAKHVQIEKNKNMRKIEKENLCTAGRQYFFQVSLPKTMSSFPI